MKPDVSHALTPVMVWLFNRPAPSESREVHFAELRHRIAVQDALFAIGREAPSAEALPQWVRDLRAETLSGVPLGSIPEPTIMKTLTEPDERAPGQ